MEILFVLLVLKHEVRGLSKSVAAGMNALDFRRGIKLTVDAVVANTKAIAKMISTTDEIAQDGKNLFNILEVVEGEKRNRGYISPSLITNVKSQTLKRLRLLEFNHNLARKTLWVDGWSTPTWVKETLELITQSRLQSRANYGTRNWSQDTAQRNGGRHMHCADTTSEGIAVLKTRLQRGITIESHTYVKALQICWNQKDLLATKQLHKCIIKSGMEKNPYVANTLMNVYIRCRSFLDARRVFDEFDKKSVLTWNMMITGYAKSGHGESALALFNLMRQEGMRPNAVTYLGILKACASPLALNWGKEVHASMRHAGLESDVRVGTALLQMYAKCGCITEARRVFEEMTNRNLITWNVMIGAYASSGYMDDARLLFDKMQIRDFFTWNILIGAYAARGQGTEAYQLFLEMRREGFEPDAITYVSILNESASEGALEWVKDVHGHASKAGLELDLRVGNALVHMYAKCGYITEARRVFEKLTNRDFISWNVMIGAYAASGGLDDARLLFNRMEKRDLVTWNIMIGAYADRGRGLEAYQLFLEMRREGFQPDAITYINILKASASAGPLEWMKEVHDHAVKAGLESDLRVGNAFIHMYGKTGRIDDARLVFDRMVKRNVFTWTAMIGGLAQHGCGREALELFRRMNEDSVKPDGTTFVALLSACCHAGLLEDGRRLFLAMTQDYGIRPDIVHYTCMVDLLGRAGRLEEAKQLITDMPVEPGVVTWKALLGACKTHCNVKLGEHAAKQLFKLEPTKDSTYVLLSNIYAAASEWEKVSLVRSMMQSRGVRKEPGRSWIEVDNKVHEFVVGDTSHPEAKAIYSELNELTEKLKAVGYVPETKTVLQNINDEDKELALCAHSEKLAIAYGLMRIPSGKPIRVYKNLRVCSDCHSATKFISKVTGREIIARDTIRFHHFKDGLCSCGDYW